MQYFCLAAGKGTRMGTLGTYLQKCMYPIGLRPFLEYSLRELVRSDQVDLDADRLIIVVGHHGDQIVAYFGDEYDGLSVEYVRQDEPLGTGHALATAAEASRPESPVIAWLADSYVPASGFEALGRHHSDNVVTLGPGHPGESARLRATVDGDRVVRSWEGQGALFDIGAWKLSPEVLESMTSVRTADGEFRVLPNLQLAIERGAEVGFVEAEEWVHLGGTHPSSEENLAAVVSRLEQIP